MLVDSVKQELLETSNQTADPLQVFSLQPGEEYKITVVASNGIGNSSESNRVSFTAPSDTPPLSINFDPLFYIPVAVCGIAFTIIVVLVIGFVVGYRYRSESCCLDTCIRTCIQGAKILVHFYVKQY